MKRRTGVLVPLSPQNLIDCSTTDGNYGCRGGFISKAFSYVIRNTGVDSERFYPYEQKVVLRKHVISFIQSFWATWTPVRVTLHTLRNNKNPTFVQNGKCRYSVKGKAGSCSDFHILPHGDEKTLQAVVASVGPVAVAVNAMLSSFHLYRGGEDEGCDNSTDTLPKILI